MAGRVIRRGVLLALLWGVAAMTRIAPSWAVLPGFFAAGAAFALPGVWLANRFGRGGTFSRQATLGFSVAHGALALLALILYPAGASLGILLVFAAVLSLAAAFLTPMTEGGGGGVGWLILVAGALLVVTLTGARLGYRTDAWDHIGGVRRMEARGDLLAKEYFHADRADQLDPRKGTNHTLFALYCRLTGADPLDGWDAFRGIHVLFFIAAFHWLSRALLGGGAASWAGTALFVIFARFGPAGAWLTSAGYPGAAGYILFLGAVALAFDAFRDGEGKTAPLLVGAGAAGIHIFYPVLAAAAFAVFLILPRSTLSAFGSRAAFGRTAALFLAGAAPVVLFRLATSYHAVNPLHLHTQGALLLPFGLSILDYRGLIQSFGSAGWLSLFLLPFLRVPTRPWEPGELFLAAAWVATLFILVNPLLFPVLENRLGYLTRRFALLTPWPLVLGAILARPLCGPRKVQTVVPALFAAGAVLLSFTPTAALRGVPCPVRGNAVANGPAVAAAIDAIGEALPPRSTLLTDPVTGYLLYGRTLLRSTAVVDQHSSPNDPRAAQRIADTQRALHPRWDRDATDKIIDRLGADYVLVNEKFDRHFHTWNAAIDPATVVAGRKKFDARPERYRPADAPDGFHLYRVERSANGIPVSLDRKEPVAGKKVDGRTMGGDLSLMNAAINPVAALPGELVHLTASWFVRDEGTGPVPMNLHIRAVPSAEDDPRWRKPWAVRRLGGDVEPYLLWEAGDSITTRDGFRVPAEAEPGGYRIEIGVKPFPFFPVTDVRGFLHGGARPEWADAGLLEVKR